MSDTPSDDPGAGTASSGVVFCAAGAHYVAMARAAAEGVRRTDPGLPCDLFTDARDPVEGFDRTVPLSGDGRRPKIEAMRRSRFERTLFLDADVFVVNPVGPALALLDRFDIALAHDFERNSPHGRRIWREAIPASFPQFNSGVIAMRRSEGVLSLLDAWAEGLEAAGGGRDQPVLRELLWRSDLRIATLPPEFNFCDLGSLPYFRRATPAPRIVHYCQRKPAAGRPVEAAAVLGPATSGVIEAMSRADATDGAARSGRRVGRLGKRWLQARALLETLRGRGG